MNDVFETATSLHFRLDSLRAEHRELDEAITRLGHAGSEDQLMLHRLRKRKLLLRDRIAIIEQVMGPDAQA
ncbi:MAG: DUF465 domain-containing protein [Candidatus Dactylopiibacterium sp.]|nr:DUF465 domain-containing protein [Candidatus Dactylopiibacterium sp.]